MQIKRQRQKEEIIDGNYYGLFFFYGWRWYESDEYIK